MLSIDQIHEYYTHSYQKSKLTGVEIELFCIDLNTNAPLQFFGKRSLSTILKKFIQRFGYTFTKTDDYIFEIKRGMELISLEPGGQIEYSSAPFSEVQSCEISVNQFLDELNLITCSLGAIQIISCGIHSIQQAAKIQLIPKGRYKLLSNYLSEKGSLGDLMMKCTASIHVNIDYLSEKDVMKALQVVMYVAPFASSIFSNSPHINSQNEEFKSYRKHIFFHTDNDRCGILFELLKPDKRIIDYIHMVLNIPIIYLNRANRLIYVGGKIRFIEFMKYGFEGLTPTLEDYLFHLNSCFHEARLKKYLEIRCTDAQPLGSLMRPAHFWRGLLNDEIVMDKVVQFLSRLPIKTFIEISKTVCYKNSAIEPDVFENILETLLNLAEDGSRADQPSTS